MSGFLNFEHVFEWEKGFTYNNFHFLLVFVFGYVMFWECVFKLIYYWKLLIYSIMLFYCPMMIMMNLSIQLTILGLDLDYTLLLWHLYFLNINILVIIYPLAGKRELLYNLQLLFNNNFNSVVKSMDEYGIANCSCLRFFS